MILFTLIIGTLLSAGGIYLATLGGVAAINGYILLGFGTVCLLISYLSYLGGRGQSYLLQQGIKGVAKILDVVETGSKINEEPVLKLKLHIRANEMPSFETELKAGFSAARLSQASIKPGSELIVRIDPKRTGRFMIDWAETMKNQSLR